MGSKSRRRKTLAGVVALATGFAGVLLQPSMALAELCGGKETNGCVGTQSGTGNIGSGNGDHDPATAGPPSS